MTTAIRKTAWKEVIGCIEYVAVSGKASVSRRMKKDGMDKKAGRKVGKQKGKDCRFRRSQIQGDKDG
jgi:hypothetical protein